MTKTDEEYEAEYAKDREQERRDRDSRIAANESLKLANESAAKANEELLVFNREGSEQRVRELARLVLSTKLEIGRQITELQAWLAAYEAQLPIVKDTQVMLANWGTMDPNVAFKRVMALSQLKEWLAREEAHAKVYKERIATLTSKLESL